MAFFDNAHLKGNVRGTGAGSYGKINNKPKILQEAYNLGKNI